MKVYVVTHHHDTQAIIEHVFINRREAEKRAREFAESSLAGMNHHRRADPYKLFVTEAEEWTTFGIGFVEHHADPISEVDVFELEGSPIVTLAEQA